MPRLHHTVEPILPKLPEAEVAMSKGQSVAHANSCPLPRNARHPEMLHA
jgi:hypothetical protein